MTVDELELLVTANKQQFDREINGVQGSISGLGKSTSKTTAGMSRAFGLLKGAVVALGIGKVIKDSIQIGMNAIESDNLFEVAMGKYADSTRAWSEEIQNVLGVNAVELRKTTGTIYNMVSSMGVAEDNAYKMSKGVAMLSNDMASFYNMSSEEAFNKISAGLTGETEPLKRIGIIVNDNTIKQVAYAQGIAQVGSELTEEQKVLARYIAIMQQTGNAQGDLARTINSPANALRILKSQVQTLGIAFSNFLMPIISAVLPYIIAFTKVVTIAFNALASFLGFKSGSSGGGVEKSTANIADNVENVGAGLSGANSEAKKLKGTLAGFDEMNVLQEQDTSIGSGAGGGGAVSGGSLDFDVGEYDAKLEWVSSTTDKVVEGINSGFAKVGEFAGKVWNSEPVQAWAFGAMSILNFYYEYYKQIGMNLIQNSIETWGNIQGNVFTTLENIKNLITLAWTDIGVKINEYSQPIIDGMVGLFDSVWKTAIDPFIQIVSKAWADFTGILLDWWTKNGKTLLDNIGQFALSVIGLFKSIWDNVLEPIIKPLLETLSWLWEKHLKGVVTQVYDFVAKLVNGALEIWNKFLQPIITYLIDKMAPAWAMFSSLVVGVLGTIIGAISDFVGGILKALGGLIDFVVGIFTGNWEKAWNGLIDISNGMNEAMIGIFKGAVNLIIDVLNSLIRGINKMHFDVPDWVPGIGGKKWGLNIPTIPKLAQGGIIDRPTLAVVGEAGREAVMPLERNTGWIDDLAQKLAQRGSGSKQGATQIIVKLGEDTIFSRFIDYMEDKSFEMNEAVVKV